MYSDGKISAPISASDPYYVMGVGQYNGGYAVGYICSNQHGKINIWSKNKPMNYNKLDKLTDNIKETLAWGLEIPSSSSSIEEALNKPIIYNNPKGGDTSPYRLTDFEGYNHNAAPLISTDNLWGDIDWDFDTESMKQFEVIRNSACEYKLSDLPMGIREAYVAFVLDGMAQRWIITTEKTFEETINGGVIPIRSNDPCFEYTEDGTKLNYYLALYSKKKTSFVEGPIDGAWYAIPVEDTSLSHGIITIHRSTSYIQLSVEDIGISGTMGNYVSATEDQPFSKGDYTECYIRMTLHNIGDVNITFNPEEDLIYIYTEGTSGETTPPPPKTYIWWENGSPISEMIEIQPQQSRTFVLSGVPLDDFGYNGNMRLELIKKVMDKNVSVFLTRKIYIRGHL